MEVIHLSAPDEVKISSSFGPGIELLMNDKKKEKETVTLTDLDKLEHELNAHSGSIPVNTPFEVKDIKVEPNLYINEAYYLVHIL